MCLSSENKIKFYHFEQMKEILAAKLSIEHILSQSQQVDDLKYLLLKKEALYLFRHRAKKNVDYYNKSKIDIKNEAKMNEFINILKSNPIDINRKILEMVEA
jgi:hypothetical protein